MESYGLIAIIGLIILSGILLSMLAYYINKFSRKEDSLDPKTIASLSSISEEVKDINKFITQHQSHLSNIIEQIKKDSFETKKDFSNTAKQFQQILIGNINMQGELGEDIVRRILGTLQVSYNEQERISNDDNKTSIPDFIINLPGDRKIIIDSKVSLDAWYDFVKADNTQDKNSAKKKHIDAIKKHVDTLHKKNYQTKVDESLDSVIMFMVNEASIHSLENESKELIEYALDKNVTIVGPSQLYFLIKIVERMWATDKQSKNIKEVANIGGKIYDTVYEVYNSISKAYTSFGSMIGHFKDAKNKLVDGRNSLKVQVEKMKEAGNLITQTDLDEVKEITINDPNAEVINLDKVSSKEAKK